MDTLNEQISHSISEEDYILLESALEEAHREDPKDSTQEVPKTKELLPVNSPTLLIDETTSRFSSAIWFDKIQNQTVTLAGVGGIGSYVAFLLSRLRLFNLMLFDDDIVERTNISGQLFRVKDVGTPKVSAMKTLLGAFSDYYNVNTRIARVTEDYSGTKIMICGFDNMTARKSYFKSWKKYINSLSEKDKSECLFIDGRLAAEEFQVFCMKGDDTFLHNKYENEWLFNDNEAEATLCSYKQTSFCANMIASVMVNLFVNFIANQCSPIIERELPFYTYYDASLMALKTKIV